MVDVAGTASANRRVDHFIRPESKHVVYMCGTVGAEKSLRVMVIADAQLWGVLV